MAQLKLIKSLKRSTPTMLDKLAQFVFGDMIIDMYDENKKYKVGDYTYIIGDDGTITFYECIEETSGEFDPSKWKVVSVIGIMGSLIRISESTPTDPNVIIWHKPVSYGFGDVDKIIPEMNPDKFTYSVDDSGYVTITGLAELQPGETQHFYGAVKTPDRINGQLVTSIATNAFSDVAGITDLVITDNIMNIDVGAFMPSSDGELLSSVSFGYGLEVIRQLAFANQTLITELDIPATVDKIETSAFEGCASIVNVYIHGRSTVIEDDAFLNCAALSNIYGIKYSTAEEFANKNGYTFIEI